MEKGEPSYPAGRNVNWGSHMEKSMEVSQKSEKQSYPVTQQFHSRACIWRTNSEGHTYLLFTAA